jgi:hypothetical protein
LGAAWLDDAHQRRQQQQDREQPEQTQQLRPGRNALEDAVGQQRHQHPPQRHETRHHEEACQQDAHRMRGGESHLVQDTFVRLHGGHRENQDRDHVQHAVKDQQQRAERRRLGREQSP